jgi:hypothetical protein
MAKTKGSLLALAKALPKQRHGGSFEDKLNEKQLAEFKPFVAWLKGLPKHERPAYAALKKAMEDTIGVSCAQSTLKRFIEG